MEKKQKILIIGAGPAGLAAAYKILKEERSISTSSLQPGSGQAPQGIEVIILEKEDRIGGMCKTVSLSGFMFDMGGHRFFTKNNEVNEFWHEVLGDSFIKRNRLSRICYKNKFYNYPLKLSNVIGNLGLVESFLVLGSYVKQKIFPYKKEDDLERWYINRFGKRLFNHFFKNYTEKLWGIPCDQINSKWGAQRIKNLSVMSAIKNAIFPQRNKKKVIKTLIDSFEYPKKGAGQMYDVAAEKIIEMGGKILKKTEVIKLITKDSIIESVKVRDGSGERIIEADEIISSMPLNELVKKIDSVDEEVKEVAGEIRFRGFLTICLIMNQGKSFLDNWIYIHSEEVKMGRIQNFKNWSPFMLAEEDKTTLGLEYFCDEGDDFWNKSDKELINIGLEELEKIGLGLKKDYIDGLVERVACGYPVYNNDYEIKVEKIKEFVLKFKNLQTIGRQGLFRYNNMDHSILSGFYAGKNILNNNRDLDVWTINAEEEYHEEKSAPMVKKVFLGKTNNFFIQFFRYFIVGGTATIFDILSLYILVEVFAFHYLLANSTSFLIGLSINYSLSLLWVFERNKLSHKMNFFIFAIIGLIGLGFNNLIIWLLVEQIGFWYMHSKFISTALVLFWNFLARRSVMQKFK